MDEIVSVSPRGVVSLQHVGQRRTLSLPVEGGARSPPVLGDLDGDDSSRSSSAERPAFGFVRFNGVLQTDAPIAFPLKDEAGAIEAPAVLADLDDDGRPEIFAGSNGGLLYGLTATGEALPGFPISTGAGFAPRPWSTTSKEMGIWSFCFSRITEECTSIIWKKSIPVIQAGK